MTVFRKFIDYLAFNFKGIGLHEPEWDDLLRRIHAGANVDLPVGWALELHEQVDGQPDSGSDGDGGNQSSGDAGMTKLLSFDENRQDEHVDQKCRDAECQAILNANVDAVANCKNSYDAHQCFFDVDLFSRLGAFRRWLFGPWRRENAPGCMQWLQVAEHFPRRHDFAVFCYGLRNTVAAKVSSVAPMVTPCGKKRVPDMFRSAVDVDCASRLYPGFVGILDSDCKGLAQVRHDALAVLKWWAEMLQHASAAFRLSQSFHHHSFQIIHVSCAFRSAFTELSAMFSSPYGVAGMWQAGDGVDPACLQSLTAVSARHVNTRGGFSHA